MAFTPKNYVAANPPEENHKEEESYDDNMAFLNPKKDLKQENINDQYAIEMAQKGSHQYTLRTLNALKIVSPIIAALLENPGADAPNEEMSASFRHLITQTSEIAEKFCKKMEIDTTQQKNFWIRNVVEKTFAEILRIQWVNTGKTNVEELESLFDNILDIANTQPEKITYTDLSPRENVALATLKSTMPIWVEAKTNFDLYRNIEEDLPQITEKLFNTTAKAVDKIADEYASPQSRAMIFNIILQEAGYLYAASWKAEVKKIKSIMESFDPEKLKKSVEKYKETGGFPLNRIDTDFDKYFEKMVIITDKLVKTQKGSMDKRMKK